MRIVWLSVASGVGIVAAVTAAICGGRSGGKPAASVRTTPARETHRWRFDEPSGSKAQDSEVHLDGTLGGGVYSCTPSRMPGRVKGALAFDGTNDYVGFASSLAHLNGALTVSAWVKPDQPPAVTGKGRVVANTFSYTAKRGWLLGCQYGAVDRFEFQFYSPTGGLETVFCMNFFRDWSNRWVHVAGVFKPAVSGSDGTLALYTNGVLAASKATACTAIGTTNMNLRIGARAGDIDQGMWSGLIDEVNIVGAALSPEGIRAQFAGP